MRIAVRSRADAVLWVVAISSTASQPRLIDRRSVHFETSIATTHHLLSSSSSLTLSPPTRAIIYLLIVRALASFHVSAGMSIALLHRLFSQSLITPLGARL